MRKLFELKEGFAIVKKEYFDKYGKNAIIYRYEYDLEEAKYDCYSLYRCDGVNYAVYDAKKQTLVY